MHVTEVAMLLETRRCGVGKILLRGVEEYTGLCEVESLYLKVDTDDLAARKMYEKTGYFKMLPGQAPEHFMSSLNFLGKHSRIPFKKYMDSNYARWDLTVGEAFLRL